KHSYMRLLRITMKFYVFFSSRRRHTRAKRDWSSDVCSSDLHPIETKSFIMKCIEEMRMRHKISAMADAERAKAEKRGVAAKSMQIGRASCRKESRHRWWQYHR